MTIGDDFTLSPVVKMTITMTSFKNEKKMMMTKMSSLLLTAPLTLDPLLA